MKVVDVVTHYADGDFSVSMDRLPGQKAAISAAVDRAKVSFETVTAQARESEKFIIALDEMTKQHALGWIDEQIPVKEFSGTYQRAAELVNTLVRSHIDVKMKIVEVVTKYSNGDFSVPMDRLPGKKAQITQAVDRVGALMQTADFAVNDVMRVLGALARNDLTESITNEYEGKFGRLRDDSNTTVESLTRTVTGIKEAAETVGFSSREISDGNDELAKRTEEQAASLEETAASMEQLTATVKQNAENAKEASQLAIGASSIAVRGGQVVGEVVQTMAAINGSAKKIVDIISVIDGIAFQTNILALNAAVEAARAGEQGRGFAVVAGEVRTLAQRSAAAAKEIKELIGDSVEKTTAGSRLVDQAGETMGEIVASVKRVTDIIAAIAAASQEQGSGIGQVNEAIGQMDTVVQQNAAMVEQIAASAEALDIRSQALVGLVDVFTVAGRSGGPAAAAPLERAAHAPAKAAKPARTPPVPRASAPRIAKPEVVDEDAWSSF
jgi:methyl-accepting chemotaxis protein